MRKYPLPAAIAAAHAAKARRPLETGLPLYLPAYDERPGFIPFEPVHMDDDEAEVDASGITVGGDEDDDLL